jgi:hypothetical protein
LLFGLVRLSIPHYSYISNGYEAEKYLNLNLPTYLVTCLCQIRLNFSIVYNQHKWYNLSMFERKICKLCGEDEYFAHLFECQQLADLRTNIFPPYVTLSNSLNYQLTRKSMLRVALLRSVVDSICIVEFTIFLSMREFTL